MKKEFVHYELAVKLKELGFDERCLFAFDNCSTPMRCTDLRTSDQKFNGVNYNSSSYTSQPTFSQAFRFFREKYNLYSFVFKFDEGFGYETFKEGVTQTNESFDTYDEAELACLTKLIEIVEQQKQN